MREENIKRFVKGLRTGFYTMIILELLDKKGALYGYRIRAFIREASGGALNPSESTIYEALRELERRGFIKSFWGVSEAGPPRKYYEITIDGRRLLERLEEELGLLVDIVVKARRVEGDG